MQRVCVVGPCGAGKSTFALALARTAGLPVFHMDRLHWKPGWVESPREVLVGQLEKIVAGERWIIEGNYLGTMHLRLGRADTVIFLDYPPRIYRWRILKRVITGWGRTRPDMTEGCPERFDAEFFRYVWRFDRDKRPGVLEMIAGLRLGQALHTFRHPREARDFLASLR